MSSRGAMTVYAPVEARAVFAAPMDGSGEIGAELGKWDIRWVKFEDGSGGLTGTSWTVGSSGSIDPDRDIGSQLLALYDRLSDLDKLAFLTQLVMDGCAESA